MWRCSWSVIRNLQSHHDATANIRSTHAFANLQLDNLAGKPIRHETRELLRHELKECHLDRPVHGRSSPVIRRRDFAGDAPGITGTPSWHQNTYVDMDRHVPHSAGNYLVSSATPVTHSDRAAHSETGIPANGAGMCSLDDNAALHVLLRFLDPHTDNPQRHTANTLRSLYFSVTYRSQLCHLSATHMSKLISLFGTLSIPSPRPRCIFMSRYVSCIEEHTFRTYWPMVLKIGQDKERIHGRLNSKDRFWMMRALLARVDVTTNRPPRSGPILPIIRQARYQYERIYKLSREPEVHIPYFRALLSLNATEYHEELVDKFCKLFRSLKRLDRRLSTLLWMVVLTPVPNLPTSRQDALLSVVVDALRQETQSPSLDEQASLCADNAIRVPRTEDLVNILSVTIFPKSSMPWEASVVQWATAKALSALGGDLPLASRWTNLTLLALCGSIHSIDHFILKELTLQASDPRCVEWRTILSLANLEKKWSTHTNSSIDSQDFIWFLWKTWKWMQVGTSRPINVTLAIVATFFRLSALMADSRLKDSCHRFCLEHGLLSHAYGSRMLTASTQQLVVDYIVACVACGSPHWPSIFSSLGVTLSQEAWQPIMNVLLKTLTDRDLDIAHSLLQFSHSRHITISPHVLHYFSVALTSSSSHIDLAIPCLASADWSQHQRHRLLRAVLRTMSLVGRKILIKEHAKIVAEALISAYEKHTPSSAMKGPIQQTLLCLVVSGQSHRVIKVVRAITSRSPTYLGSLFMAQLLRRLIRHRHFRLATELFRSLNMTYHFDYHLRQHLVLGLAFGGAHSLAKQACRAGPCLPLSVPVTLLRATRFRPRNPSRVLALRVLPKMKYGLSDPESLACALSILMHARRPLAARKLFAGAAQKLDSLTKTRLGNILLHGFVFYSSTRNGRLVRHTLRMTSHLADHYGFVRDRVTINILLKSLLRWRKFMDASRVRALFDHMIRGGYPAAPCFRQLRTSVPFNTSPIIVTGFLLPPLPPFISFERHTRPMYKMFIKAFHVRGDVRAASTVIGILKAEEAEVRRRREARERARFLGRLKARKTSHITV